MPLMDEFKEERAAVKNGTLKQKITYFLDYYKWYVVFAAVAVIFAVSFIRQAVSRRDTAFYAMLLDAVPYDYMAEAENTDAFGTYAGIDTEKNDIIYDISVQPETDGTAFYASQQIMAHIVAGELDVMVSGGSSLLSYAYLGDFYDLRDLLDEAQLEKYRDSFYYIDGAVLEEIDAARKDNSLKEMPAYMDPLRPEDMQDPIPVGLLLWEGCPLLEDYAFQGGNPVVCVLINTKHPETASLFIDFQMNQRPD